MRRVSDVISRADRSTRKSGKENLNWRRKTKNSLCLIFVLRATNDHAVNEGKLRLQNAENVIE